MGTHVMVRCAFQGFRNDVGHTFQETEIDSNVADFRVKISTVFGVPTDEIELTYCGHVMRDDHPLEVYGVTSGATILVSKRPTSPTSHVASFDAAALQKVSSAVKIRTRRTFRQALEKLLDDPTTVQGLINNTLPLASDPVAVALLQDADLLLLTMNDSTARLRVFEAHPTLGDAVVELMKLVGKEMERSSLSVPSIMRQQYNLDRMDDEEQESEDNEAMEVNSNQTANEPSGAEQYLPAGGVITADFFRQAMMAATGQTVPPPVTDYVTEEKLQQLRDMGIADDALARRALEISHGDIQAALEFIFGDDI